MRESKLSPLDMFDEDMKNLIEAFAKRMLTGKYNWRLIFEYMKEAVRQRALEKTKGNQKAAEKIINIRFPNRKKDI